MKLKYDTNTPAPAWAILEARRRMGFQTKGSHILKWENAILALRHCAWLIATYEPELEPIDPVILKARKLYCAVNDIDEEFIEKNGGWGGGIRREAVARVVEMLNAEA